MIGRGRRMHAELRQAYDREMHAAAEHYSGNNLDLKNADVERPLLNSVIDWFGS